MAPSRHWTYGWTTRSRASWRWAAGRAVFVSGSCFAPAAGIRALEIVADGAARARRRPRHAAAGPVPRAAPHARPVRHGRHRRRPRLGRGPGPAVLPQRVLGARSLRAPVARTHARLGAARRARRRPRVTQALASLAEPPTEPPLEVEAPAPGDGPLVAICMATYDPPPDLLRRQLESIRAQTHRNWVCVISDDCSTPERFAALERGGRPATRASRCRARRAGAASTATSSAPWRWPRPTRTTWRMADQDDDWHPDKLATLLDGAGRCAAGVQRPAGDLAPGRAAGRHLLVDRDATTTPTSPRCWWPTR